MDPGIDDALAIILALRSPELEVQAITTVAGNAELQKTTVNALRALEAIRCVNIPVAAGMPRPLLRELVTASFIHGSDGLGDSSLPKPKIRQTGRHAVNTIHEILDSHPTRAVSIIATGPLTNIASAILLTPEAMARVQRLVVMGGAYGVTQYGYGNVTSVAEYNIHTDPEAAKIVFDSGLPVRAVGLDVTTQPDSQFTRAHYHEASHTRTRTARFVERIIRRYMRRFDKLALHDPVAVAVTACEELGSYKPYHVDVETMGSLTLGQTVICRGNRHRSLSKANAEVSVKIKGSEFLDLFMDRVVRT